MTEKIYTIPINESFEQDCECPFCFLEKKLESDAVSYALGAAMMEPDYRIISNEKGYCNKHFSMMFAKPNKLSLALVLETHLAEVISKLEKHNRACSNPSAKKTLFKKRSLHPDISAMLGNCQTIQNSCVICEKIHQELTRYTEVFFYMWEKDNELKKKVINSKGFCIKHFNHLCAHATTHLKNPKQFISTLYKLQLENLERIKEEVHKFTLKFDYRNKDMPLGTAEDSPIRAIEKLSGYSIPIKPES